MPLPSRKKKSTIPTTQKVIRFEVRIWALVLFAISIIVLLATLVFLLLNYRKADTNRSFYTNNSSSSGDTSAEAEDIDFEFFYEVKDLLESEYLRATTITNKSVSEGLVRGLVDSLEDPHTVFFDRDETLLFAASLGGELEGIGIEITYRNDLPVIITPLEGSPAKKAGLLPNDIIISIDNEDTIGMSFTKIVSRIRGKKGTEVTIGVLRENEERRSFTITRETISVPSVQYDIYDNIAHIQLISFSETTLGEWETAIKAIEKRENLDGIILDVRYNPGGLFNSAVDVLSYFIPKDTLVVTERNAQGDIKEHRTSGNSRLKDIQLVVLQNKGTGSAAEIVSIALKELNNAPIIGEASFGKSTVQRWHHFSNQSSIKFTVSEWLSPEQSIVPKNGIEPDILVKDDIETMEDEQLQRAIEYLQNN